MRSVAEDLRKKSRDRLASLSPEARLALAFRLGDEAVNDYARLHGLDPRAAARALARNRQVGRRPSRCLQELGE